MIVDHVHAIGHDHGYALGVVLVVDLDWRFGSRYGAPRVALSLLRKPWSLYWYVWYFECACL